MKTIWSYALMFACVASPATAGGLNLAWTKCYGEGSPITNKNFACAANTGTNVAVASFIPNMTSATVNGNEIVLDLQSSGATLPAWWAFKNIGTCRAAALSATSTADANNLVCLDEFAGQATSGIGAYTIGVGGGANTARLVVLEAVPASALAAVAPNSEFFALSIAINNTKTTGTGSCAGCTTPMCIQLTSIKITAGGGNLDEIITNAASNSRITWQGVVGVTCPLKPAGTPTWGAIRSLLR